MDPLWCRTATNIPRRGGFGVPPEFPTGDYSPTRRLFAPILNRNPGENVDTRSVGCPCLAQRLPANQRAPRLVDVGPLVISHAQAAEKVEKRVLGSCAPF
jgi:hypothetical protein